MLVSILLAACRYGPEQPYRATDFGHSGGPPWAVVGGSPRREAAACEVAAGLGATAARGCGTLGGESNLSYLGPLGPAAGFTGVTAGAGAERGAWRTRINGSLGDAACGGFFHRLPYPLDALVAALYAGDGAALPALLDAVEEMGAGVDQLLQVGETYYIRTPTYHYFGTIQAAGTAGVVLAPGAFQASWLADLPTTLATGRLSPRDEGCPLPHATPIPFLWIGPCNHFPFPLDWSRTHPPVTAAQPPHPPGWSDPDHANPDYDAVGMAGEPESDTDEFASSGGVPNDAVMAGYAPGLG